MKKGKLIIKILYLAFMVMLAITNLTRLEARQIPASNGEKVVFSEVLYDSSVDFDTEGEWIELYNPQSWAIDISKWTIEDNTATIRIPSGTTIGPHISLIDMDVYRVSHMIH